MVDTFVDLPLRYLEILENHGSLASPVKDGISTLKKELRFLRTFLIYPAKAIPCGWLNSIEAAFTKPTEELSSACGKPTKRVDGVVSAMLEKVKNSKPEIRKAYRILWEEQQQAAFESSSPRLDPRALMDFLDSVLENLSDLLLISNKSLVIVVKNKLGSLKEKLSFLRNFLYIVLENENDDSSKSNSQEKMISFLNNSLHMATTSAACLSYMCWVDDEMDDSISLELYIKISDLLHKTIKLRTSNDIDMYLGLLKAASTRAAKVSGDDVGLLKAASSVAAKGWGDDDRLLEGASSMADKGWGDDEGLLEEASSMGWGDDEGLLEEASSMGWGDDEGLLEEASSMGWGDEDDEKSLSTATTRGSEKDKTTDTVVKRRVRFPPKRGSIKSPIMQSIVSGLVKVSTAAKGSRDDRGFVKFSTAAKGSGDDRRLVKSSTAVKGSGDGRGLVKASMTEKGSENDKTDEVTKFVKFVVDNSLDSIINDQVDSIRKELEYLMAFLMDLPDNCWGDLFWISNHIKAAAIKAGSLNIDMQTGKKQLSDLLKEIYLLKARVILRRLDNSSKDGLMVPMKDELKPLVQVLEFLQTFSFDPPVKKLDEEKLLLSHAEIVSREVTSLIYLIQETELTNVTVMKMKLSLSWLLPKIYLINTDIKLIGLLSQKANLVSNMVNQIECLREELRFLRTFLMDTIDIEDKKLLLTRLEGVYSQSFSLISSFLYNEMATESSLSLPRLLGHIKLIKAEVILEELQTHRVGLMAPMKDQVKSLYQELGFFITFLYYPHPSWMYDEKKELNLSKGEAVASEAASLIFLFHNDMKRGNMANNFSKLIDKIVRLKQNIKEIFVQIPESFHSDLPMMPNGLNLISSLLEDMRELLKCEPSSISSVKHVIKMLDSGFVSLQGFLLVTAEQRNDDEEIKDLCTYISHVVYEAEYMIDSFVVKVEFVWHFMLWVYFAMEDITFAREKVMEVQKEKKFDTKYLNVTKTSFHVPSQATSGATDELLVELEDQKQIIIDRLTQGRVDLDIIAIVGMPGLGKTTLAKEVYDCPSVAHFFNIRAWCCLSQVYDPQAVLLNILGHVAGITGSIHEMEYDKLQEQLYKFLKGRRYLVIIDDLWDINQWDKLKRSFPNDDKGSRILVTCRTSNLVCQAKPDSFVHSLRLFSDLESWKFLEKKVFYLDACPPTLQEIGKQISSHCRGLPITISVIGGLLANTERKLDWWVKVEKNLRYGNFIVDPYVHVLEFCYEQLPPHLKPCFLYFAAFPEGKEIPVWKLFRLWVAEGFVQKTESQMLEDVAEGYLLDLINRNLVILAKRRSVGGVKACFIHELLWDLCMAKAKDEKFMLKIQHYDEFSTTCHRLCLCSSPEQFVMLRPSGPCVRCLLFSASNDASPGQPSDISFISQKFQLLRVLDLEGINMGNSFPTGLEILVLLRYLAVRGSVDFVPSLISNLSKLETFILLGLKHDFDVALPDTFWSMKRLRHVHVKNSATFSLQNCELENSSQLDNMQTLSSPTLCCRKHTEKILTRLPKLRKLKCIFRDSRGYKCNEAPALELLACLESLNITVLGKKWSVYKFDFLYNLKKLTLSRFSLEWREMSTIGRLPNLEVLKLLGGALLGQEWNIRGEFLKLKYLKLENFNIVQWSVGYDPFPCLQQLVLRRCEQLKEVPSSFGDIITLQSIEVVSCNFSAERSAIKIKEEQRSRRNDKLKVLINPQMWR